MHIDGLHFLARLLLCATLLVGTPPGSTPLTHVGTTATAIVARMPQRLFISGHSLTDRPYPDFLAASVGGVFDWEMQHLFGSALRDRTRGIDGSGSGYRAGVDRHGKRADVLRAFAASGHPPYDALLLVEQHSLLESLLWKDMVPSAVDIAQRFRAANHLGSVYLFASWLNIDDLADPDRWIAYERAAGIAWRCAAGQIARETGAPVTVVPAAEALAFLVGQHPALAPKIFADDVHLTSAGSYYVALVTHGVFFGGLPDMPWVPPALDRRLAMQLQQAARAFLAIAPLAPPDAEQCRAYLADRFAPHYLAYVRDARWRRSDGWRAYLKWLRFRIAWPRLLRSTSPANPFAESREAT